MFLSISIFTLGSLTILVNWQRERRMRGIKENLQKPLKELPAELKALWEKNRIWKFASENSVLLGTGGFTAAQALFHLHRMDNQVFDAIDTIYQPGVENNFNNIVTHLHELDSKVSGALKGGIEVYKGQLGEVYMAEYLSNAGHNVELADTTNQAGWDAIVDGQMINFKSGANADHIQEHIEKYPDIPVITVSEQSANFIDNEMVVCLEGVSGQYIEQTTQDAVDSVLDATNLGFDIPIVTLGLATAKNFKTVMHGHNDIGTAAIYTVSETTGIGLGAMGGAKIGTLIGSFGGPLGMAIGTIICGIAGGRTGRQIVKMFKERKLRRAIANQENAVANYGKAYTEGLFEKASSLQLMGDKYNQPSSFWRWLRPQPSDLIQQEIYKCYVHWSEACFAKAQSFEKETKKNKDNYKTIGNKVFFDAPQEAVYSSQIQKAFNKIREEIEIIIQEKNRLGLRMMMPKEYNT